MMHHIVLAVGTSTDFWSTQLGAALGSIMKAVAVLVVLIAAAKAVKDVMAGKGGKAVQLIVGALVVVTLLWDPSLINTLIGVAANLVGKTGDSVNQLANTR